ncbi:LOW QUALITY PROTEIN: hypothetical protein V2J09_017909, partial [Rumex salicifolius]
TPLVPIQSTSRVDETFSSLPSLPFLCNSFVYRTEFSSSVPGQFLRPEMAIQRRRHQNHVCNRLLRRLPTNWAIYGAIFCAFFLLAFFISPPHPSDNNRRSRLKLDSSNNNGSGNFTGDASLLVVPGNGGKSQYDLWRSRDSEFYRGCSKSSSNYARADKVTVRGRYLVIVTSGGLNQQRTGIVDAVAAARILNVTLVVPQLDQRSYWKDASNFEDIFDIDQYISYLSNDVKIIKELPKNAPKPHTVHIPRKCSENCYNKRVLPVLNKRHVVRLTKFDYRVANKLPTDLQKLRCRVNYHALQFTDPISKMGNMLVQRMKMMSKNYIALHLRFEPDMLAFSGCYYGGGDKEIKDLGEIRKRWKGLHQNPEKARRHGRCLLTPEEVGLMLRALGYGSEVHLYVASGEVYGGEASLAPLKSLFPNFHSKDTIASKEELEAYSKFSSRRAALDFIVCDESDVFVTNNNGNMAKILAGRRRYFGHKPTIRPNGKKLYRLFANRGNMTWEEFASRIRTFQRGFLGMPKESRPGRGEFHENPSTCICEDTDALEKRNSKRGARKIGKGKSPTRREAEDDEYHNAEDDMEWIDPDYDADNGFHEQHSLNGTELDYDGVTTDEPELEDMVSD